MAESAWSRPETVAGFVASPPNATLLELASAELPRAPRRRAFDLGCGAARNAVPLAAQGWRVLGLDLSLAMLHAARDRVERQLQDEHPLHLALAAMDRLPVADASADLLIAHGIWNLARSGEEFRQAVREAARAAAHDAALFVFTQFSGEPQCFLTGQQLLSELEAGGFVPDAAHPLRELNRPLPGALTACRAPVIYEGLFRRRRQ